MRVFKFFIEILVLFIYSNFFICIMCCDVFVKCLHEKEHFGASLKIS